jgi:hypothetical protein
MLVTSKGGYAYRLCPGRRGLLPKMSRRPFIIYHRLFYGQKRYVSIIFLKKIISQKSARYLQVKKER